MDAPFTSMWPLVSKTSWRRRLWLARTNFHLFYNFAKNNPVLRENMPQNFKNIVDNHILFNKCTLRKYMTPISEN